MSWEIGSDNEKGKAFHKIRICKSPAVGWGHIRHGPRFQQEIKPESLQEFQTISLLWSLLTLLSIPLVYSQPNSHSDSFNLSHILLLLC